MIAKNIARTLAVAACLFALSACDDKKAEEPQQASKSSAEQAEITKYNAYIEAANMSSSSFGEQLDQYKKYIAPAFTGEKPRDDLFFPGSDTTIPRVKDLLDKARAMEPEMKDLDASATRYSEALGQTEPVNRELYNYINAKTYKSDNGDKGRELQPKFISAMEKLVVAQADFLNAVDKKDRERIKAEYEKTPKDTAAYYRIGSIYYLKESMDAANGFINGEGLGDKKDAFKKSLDQFNEALTAYDAKMRESNKKGCSSLIFTANSYLSTGRDVIEHTDSGIYEQEAKRSQQFQMMQSTQENDVRSLMQNYNNVINAINIGTC
ncbi:YiiG family protein [Kosakonia sp. SMBL-WEM22]|uniref:DUF3829 domain-containing protein n=1 Tax=Kosakonia sp. SMBL-WEM22 TaxID=2725560 RepID=UPI0016591A17|nr:DUF3829 domain-containing protein [Kosakonia sp. SMBL-WEM22]QNQ20416.1 YiiG family protein [Kosakonia sp. SMBL-WEM22]